MPQVKTILYIAGLLPKRSETFVTSEILALRSLGYRVLCASVHPPERALGEAQLEALADEALPIYGMGLATNIHLAFQELLVRPRTFLKTLGNVFLNILQEPVEATRNAHKLCWQLIGSLALAHRLRSKNIAHIHAHMGHVPTTIAWLTALHLKLPYSFTGHAADLFRHRCLLKTKLRSASFVSCISLWHRNFYTSILPGSALKYPLIRCGVDITRFKPVLKNKSNPFILSVGRLVQKKGFDILLNAFAKLRESGSELNLLIGGDGPEFARLRALRKQLDLEASVSFLGALSHEEVKALLPDATLFVLPCRIDSYGDRDGIPVVLMEAMAAGVPCVSGDLPAIRELITDGHTGKLVSSEDAEVWKNTLLHLLTNPAEQARYSRNARQWVECEFSSDVNIPRLVAAFEGIPARNMASPPEHMKYVLITPCRDEARFAERCIQSVLNQTVRPACWVIVDDGSCDGTSTILAKYAAQNPWMHVVSRQNRGRRSVGAGVVEAFYAGLQTVCLNAFPYLCKFDLDLEIPRAYFETLILRMEADPRLGTCSGKPYFEQRGRWISERCGDEMSVGMTKFYRVSCFQDIGGFVKEVMWDGIDCHRCRMKGWIACSWNDPDLRFLHLRPMGASQDSLLKGRQRHGFGQYFMGTGWLYICLSALTRIFHPPYILGSVSILWGYTKSAWKKHPRYPDQEFRRFLRSFQWKCLLFGKNHASNNLHKTVKRTQPSQGQ